MDEFEDAEEGAHEEDDNIVSPSNGATHSFAFITGLADALTDPPDNASGKFAPSADCPSHVANSTLEEDVHDDEESDAELPKTTSKACASSPKKRSLSEGIGKTVTDTIRTVDTSAPADGDEPAALINSFIVVDHGPKTLPSTANSIRGNLKQRKASKLKRLSQKGEPLYRGIAPSSGVQRRLVSNPKDVFEVDVSPDHFIAPKRTERAISIDPSSMAWQVRDTTHNTEVRRQRLSPQVEIELSSATNTTALQSRLVQDRDVDRVRAPSSPVFSSSVKQKALGSGRKRGRPRKARSADSDDLVPTASENLPSGKKRGRPPKARPEEAGSPEVAPAQIISTGKKRGRPPKAGPEAAGSSEIRPQKALKMTATQKGSTSDTAEESPIASATTSLPEASADNPSSWLAKNHDTNPAIRVNPVDLNQNTGESHSPLFEGSGSPSREHPREPPKDDIHPEPNEHQREHRSDTGVSQLPGTQEHAPGNQALEDSASGTQPREVRTGDSRTGIRTRSLAPSERSPFESDGNEHDEVEFPVSASKDLRTALRYAKKMGWKREGKHLIRLDLPTVKSAAVQKLLLVHERTRDFIAKLVAAEEAVTSETDLELRTLVKSVSTKARDIIRDPEWDNRRTVRDLYVHVLPKLTILLHALIKFYSAELSWGKLKVSQTLMLAIVDLGLKVKEAKSEFTLSFPVKDIRRGIVSNVQQVLKEFEDRIAELESRRKAQIRKAKHEDYLRQRETEEMQTQLREEAVQAWKARWSSLHCDRLIAELQKAHLLPAATLRHLATPPLTQFGAPDLELDGNGEPIERVELFGRRQTLPPGRNGAHNAPKWTQDESYTLVKGLREFSGPRAYHKIISQYCQAGQLLNKYNVSEIVDRAMWLREQMVRTQRETQQEPWAWLLAISDPRVPPVFED
ncbi:hypothetical protein BDV97DRAFT_353081 [Delphinella strobiligena]|nr:hypothetical protein BDV97DRAFT_353081 [Delphinella strobiligena]